MSIESATYIASLNDDYPEPEADRNTADNHLRLIKKVLLNTFPNLDAEVTAIPDDLNQLGDALDLVDGVTSNIQDQLDGKLKNTTDTFTGKLTLTGGSGQCVVGTCAIGSNFAAQFTNTSSEPDSHGIYGKGGSNGAYGVLGYTDSTHGCGVYGSSQNGSVFAMLGYDNTYSVHGVGPAYISGDITSGGNVTAYSDERLKADVRVIEGALDKLDGIRGVTFRMKDAPEDSPRRAGLIAQEVLPALPEVVIEHNGIYTVAYGNFVSLLVQAVKELRAEVAELRAKLP